MGFPAVEEGSPSSLARNFCLSAGKPILGQILSYDLTDVLIVVVRYFGGIKLGVSGLINAYRAAAADAIGHARIVEKTDDEVFRIKFDYTVMNEVMRVVKEEEPEVMSRDFSMECRMTLSIRKQNASRLSARLQQIESHSFED